MISIAFSYLLKNLLIISLSSSKKYGYASFVMNNYDPEKKPFF